MILPGRSIGIGMRATTRPPERRSDHRWVAAKDAVEHRPRGGVARELRALLGDRFVLTEPEDLRVYDCDGLTGWRAQPALVVLPGSTEEVQAVVRLCHRHGVPFVARGAGTGLSGGALPVADGIVISLARMNRILEVDLDEPARRRRARRDEPRRHRARSRRDGFYYAPDPSSQQVCTIGGNVAENSGGAHCLKHGFTVNHVTGLRSSCRTARSSSSAARRSTGGARPARRRSSARRGRSGSRPRSRCASLRAAGGGATLLAGFDSTDAAGGAVSAVVARRDPPGGDRDDGPAHDRGGRAAVHAGYPDGAGAILLVELDGVARRRSRRTSRAVEEICRANGACEVRIAHDADGARAPVEGAQGGVRRDGPRSARLLRPGRRRAADAAARGPAADRRARARARPPGRQRLPRRRRQPPPARPLRRARPRRGRAGGAARRRRSSRSASTPAAR